MNLLLERVRKAMRPDYEIEAELGRGGMGIVYLAREVALQRPVAIKILLPGLDTVTAVEAFYREAQMLARVHSSHVVVVHRVGEPEGRDGLFYLVMQLIRGETVMQRLNRGAFPPGEALRLGADLLTGLEAVHQAEICHGDIKPANIFLTESGAVIGDFGIARLEAQGGVSGTFEARSPGTPDYMAPEQRAGTRPTRQSDIYQAGIVLYEACTGRRWVAPVDDSRDTWRGVPRRVVTPLARALRPTPAERWPDARTFRKALHGTERRAPWLLAIGAIVAVVAALALPGIWPPTPSQGVLRPRVDLTLLRFSGPDTIAAIALLGYTGERLESFNRIRVRPISISRSLLEPTAPEQVIRLNSSYYVTGQILGDGLLDLAVFDGTGRALRRIAVPRQELDALSWGRTAADSLVCRLFHDRCTEYRNVAGLGGSDDAVAVDSFLAGVDAFQRDAYRVALGRFEFAAKVDPGFALARWQRALVRRWRRIITPVAELRDLFDHYAASLDPRFVALLEAQLENDLPSRFAKYREVIAASPELGDARLLYADELFHRGALIGLPLESGLAAMQAAIDADSTLDQAPALDHMIWGWVRLGHAAQASRALKLREAVARQHHTAEYDESARRTRFLRLAYDQRFRPGWAAVKRWWLTSTADERMITAFAEYSHLGNSFDIPDAEYALGKALVRLGTHDSLRAAGYEGQGLALVLLGRPAAALPLFDSAAVAFGTGAARLEAGEWRVLPRALGMPALPRDVADGGREQVADFLDDSVLGERAAWALAMEAYTKGDIATARNYAGHGEIGASPLTGPGRLRLLLAAIDSAAAGRLAEAVTLSEPLLRYDPEVRAGDPFARSVLYLSRAAWLERLGRFPEAEQSLRWYENGDIDGWGQREAQAGEIDVALGAIARIRRARVALVREQAGPACAWLARVRELWQDAEPGLQSLRDEVATASSGICR